MTWKTVQAEEPTRKRDGIRCLTCKSDILKKAALVPAHRGHEVVYVNKAGEIDG